MSNLPAQVPPVELCYSFTFGPILRESGKPRPVSLDAIVHLSYGDMPAQHYISEVMTDLAIHGWDLARAIGDDEVIDPEIVELLHGELKPKEDELKSTGLFGPKVEAPPGADKQTQVLAIFGRVA